MRKHLYLNLKRFDISPRYGGVNRLAPMCDWGGEIMRRTQSKLSEYNDAEFVIFFPEAHLLSASAARSAESLVKLGCQSVYRADTEAGGNFGAFTSNRTANAMREMGCESTLIGHCEERADKSGVLAQGNVVGKDASDAVCRVLNQEIKAAQKSGLGVLYCIGEKIEEQPQWEDVLGAQLDIGLDGVNRDAVVIAYEPIWSIGPGKKPADKAYITRIARFIKERTSNMDVVYGGGLKQDNAEMLADIPEIDGGLIALTRFSGEIGFYPDEYLQIIKKYLGR